MKFTIGDKVKFDHVKRFEISSIHRDADGVYWYCGGEYLWVSEDRLSMQTENKEAWLIELKGTNGLCLSANGKCSTVVSDYEGALKFKTKEEAEVHLKQLPQCEEYFVADHIWA